MFFSCTQYLRARKWEFFLYSTLYCSSSRARYCSPFWRPWQISWSYRLDTHCGDPFKLKWVRSSPNATGVNFSLLYFISACSSRQQPPPRRHRHFSLNATTEQNRAPFTDLHDSILNYRRASILLEFQSKQMETMAMKDRRDIQSSRDNRQSSRFNNEIVWLSAVALCRAQYQPPPIIQKIFSATLKILKQS